MSDPYETSHWHDPNQQRNPYCPTGRRLTPYDHRGAMDEMMMPSFDSVLLHKRQFAMQSMIDRREADLISRMKFNQYEDPVTRDLITQVRVAMWGEKDQTTAIAKVPATWEDAFKLGLITVFDNPLINWFVKRSPVRYKEVKASLKVHFPDFRPSLPDQDYVCKVMICR